MATTKKDKVIAYLRERGYRRAYYTRKYDVFFHPNKPDWFYFVGRKGALRAGKNVSTSISLTGTLNI